MALTPKWGIYSDDPGMLALGNTQDTRQADSIEKALDTAVAEATWQKASLPADDLNQLTTPGSYPVTSLEVKNLPGSFLGTVEVTTAGLAVMQKYTTVQATPQTFIRRGNSDGVTWMPWVRQDPNLSAPVALYGTEDPASLSVAPAYYEVRSPVVAQNLGMPTYSTGTLVQRKIGTITFQEWLAAEGDQSVWVRSSRTDIASAQWTRVGPTLGGGTSARASSGMRVTPLAFSLPAAPATMTQAAGAARWVRSYAHAPTRIRVHISNRNPGSQDTGGTVNLLGVKVGKGTATGELTDLVEALGAVTLSADGSEAISPWIDCPAEDGGYLGITVGWEGAGTLQRLDSGGWTSTSSQGWDASSVEGWSHTAFMPFYLWVEAEIPAHVPVVVGLGDSITVGRAATDPVQDSWLAVYCRAQGAMPLFFAQSGSSMLHWVPGDARWEKYYPGVELKADALINFLGQNNMLDGQTLEQHKARYGNVKAAIDAVFPGIAFYVGGVTPSVSKSDAVTAVRREFNAWLRTLPHGARGYFDFPAAVGDEADRVLRPELAGDNLHPNTAGHALMGETVLKKPVSPFVLPDSRVRALANMGG